MGHSVVKLLAVAGICVAIISCTSEPSSSDTKIIGGKIADYQPFMISLSKQDPEKKSGFCGGSWIADGVILTAAHCVDGMKDLAKVSVSITRESDIGANNSLKVLAIIPHPQFNPEVMHNDVALLFVEPLNLAGITKPVTPIALNRKATLPEDLGKTTVIGWGNASSYGYLFGDDLRQVDVPVVALDKCRTAGEYYSTISDNEICAGDFDNGAIDSCQGDSGGPLIAIDDGTPVLVGVVSWGDACALKGKPGVYARVSSYTSWIYEQIGTYKSPVTGNEKNIKEAIAQHCYAGFSAKQNPYPDLSFEITSKFYIDQPLTQSDKEVFAGSTMLSTCSFYRLGLGQVDVEISKADTSVVTSIKIPSLNQNWVGSVREERSLYTSCVNSDLKAFSLYYEPTDFNYFYHNGGYYINDAIDNPDLSGYVLNSCTTQGTTMTFAAKENAGEGEEKFILAVESSEIGLAKKHFKLRPSSSQNDAELSATIKLDSNSETKGTLTFKNDTGNDIHTWQLECKVDITLTDAYGMVYPAQKKNESEFTHTFMTPVSIHGIIKDKSTISFAAEFKEGPAVDALKGCSVNDMPLSYNLQN